MVFSKLEGILVRFTFESLQDKCLIKKIRVHILLIFTIKLYTQYSFLQKLTQRPYTKNITKQYFKTTSCWYLYSDFRTGLIRSFYTCVFLGTGEFSIISLANGLGGRREKGIFTAKNLPEGEVPPTDRLHPPTPTHTHTVQHFSFKNKGF